mgnify:CR=1 FL=1
MNTRRFFEAMNEVSRLVYVSLLGPLTDMTSAYLREPAIRAG